MKSGHKFAPFIVSRFLSDCDYVKGLQSVFFFFFLCPLQPKYRLSCEHGQLSHKTVDVKNLQTVYRQNLLGMASYLSVVLFFQSVMRTWHLENECWKMYTFPDGDLYVVVYHVHLLRNALEWRGISLHLKDRQRQQECYNIIIYYIILYSIVYFLFYVFERRRKTYSGKSFCISWDNAQIFFLNPQLQPVAYHGHPHKNTSICTLSLCFVYTAHNANMVQFQCVGGVTICIFISKFRRWK